MSGEELVPIGKIVRAHGIKGQVKVLSYLEGLNRYAYLDRIFISRGEAGVKEYQVETIRAIEGGRYFIVKLVDCYDRGQAEQLVGAEIKLRRNQLRPLPAEHYYWFEIEGLQVYSDRGEYLGEIVDLFYTGSNDVYVIRGREGQEILIPAIREVVKAIDLDEKKMIIHLMEGLI